MESSEGRARYCPDKGILFGFVVLTGFGVIWWMMAIGQLDGGVRVALLALGVAIVAALVARMVTAPEGTRTTALAVGPNFECRDREFSTIGIIETVAIFVGIFTLSRQAHPEWIPLWCALVCGAPSLVCISFRSRGCSTWPNTA